MTAITTLVARRPARLALGGLLALATLLAGAVAADAAIGRVRTQRTALTVRSGPGTSFPAVGAVAKGARVQILCRTRGTRVAGPYGATSTWNKIGEGRYVSDAYTSSSRKAPACSSAQLGATALVAYQGAKRCSTDERGYPNGRVPASARCGLYGDEEESLRPRAAAAFNALSMAYAKQTGEPLCVSDSYRSFDEQVRVKASRGRWAATPGTSEHGLGRAVDLCGGVDRFGSAAHRWMVVNAPRLGWVHPRWAEAGGSLPEPWHWEFVG